jgi:hypothetical protein
MQTRQTALQCEVRESKSEMRSVNKQDQFAEWAKLRKKVDKALMDLESTSKSFSAFVITLTFLP